VFKTSNVVVSGRKKDKAKLAVPPNFVFFLKIVRKVAFCQKLLIQSAKFGAESFQFLRHLD